MVNSVVKFGLQLLESLLGELFFALVNQLFVLFADSVHQLLARLSLHLDPVRVDQVAFEKIDPIRLVRVLQQALEHPGLSKPGLELEKYDKFQLLTLNQLAGSIFYQTIVIGLAIQKVANADSGDGVMGGIFVLESV